jgi:hypothetical protein
MTHAEREQVRAALEMGRDWYEQGHEELGEDVTSGSNEFDAALAILDAEPALVTDKDREETDLFWCREGCGWVNDDNHRCEQWGHVWRIPKEAIKSIRSEVVKAERERVAKSIIDQLNYDDGAFTYEESVARALNNTSSGAAILSDDKEVNA